MKVLQVVGYKNAGKTTLVSEIVRSLSAGGLQVGTIKHAAHDHEPDRPGTDTWRHRQAGAKAAAMVTDTHTLWVRDTPSSLSALITAMESEGMDAVIVEGFKTSSYPKMVLVRGDEDSDLLALTGIIGIALRQPAPALEHQAGSAGIPVFHTGYRRFASVLEFITSWCTILNED